MKLLLPLLENHSNGSGNLSESITIIPDGLLSYLPFEVLIQSLPDSDECTFKNLDYLIKDYEISYSFSLNFLAFLKQKRKNNKIKNVLAFAYYMDDSNGVNKAHRISGEISLAGTKKELDAISLYFPGTFLYGKDASESNFKRLCSEFDAIHLAVHGTYDSLYNYNTYLLFNASADSLEDGNLYNYDLFPLKLNTHLAVLSACQTGLGKNNPGEGLLSMGWGFAYAGCKSLVLSLWKANDRSTTILMKDFYRQLSSTNNINYSLTKAKRSYLYNADEYTAHPRYWAAFVNYGITKSYWTLNTNRIHICIAITACILLLIIFALIFGKEKIIGTFKRKSNHK